MDDWRHDLEVVRKAALGGLPEMTERQMRLWRRNKATSYGVFALLGGTVFTYWNDLNLFVIIISLFVGWKAIKFGMWRMLGWDPLSPNGHKAWILEEAIREGIVRRVDPEEDAPETGASGTGCVPRFVEIQKRHKPPAVGLIVPFTRPLDVVR